MIKFDIVKHIFKIFFKGAIAVFSFWGFILLAYYLGTKYPSISLILNIIIVCFLVGCIINEFQTLNRK